MMLMFTLTPPCPTDTCGPLLDLRVNLMICLLAKMKSMMKVWTPTAMMITTATPLSCSGAWAELSEPSSRSLSIEDIV